MKLDRLIRIAIAVALSLLLLIAVAAWLFVTESALNVWDRLREGSSFFLFAYVGGLLILLVVVAWLMLRLLVRRRPKAATAVPLDRAEIEQRLRQAEQSGVDAHAARAELAELASRQREAALHLCFFGEISTGKSSLIKALVPGAGVSVDVRGGSTDDIRHYRWRDDSGTEIWLTDVPGSGGLESELQAAAKDEARRAQIVLFVCEGDLTRAEKTVLAELIALDKPLILVMNKSDRYSHEEQALLMERLLDHLSDLGGQMSRDRLVAVSAGGAVEIVERDAEGGEQLVRREREADIAVLTVAINRLLTTEQVTLDVKRDRAVFTLAAEKLAAAELKYREQRAAQILRGSTRNAVLGALAAVSPGTDIILQSYIGTSMTRELCRLYGVAPRDLDIEEFLTLSESRAGKALPVALAVAGNGLKAFPGVGTVAGGLVHAVAYGLIFDALGRSLLRTLEKHGRLLPEVAANDFGESLGEHIQAGARQVAKMAVAETDARKP